MKPIAVRLEEGVDRGAGPRDCWLWRGAKDAEGYGIVKVDGKARRCTRVLWELTYGPIPAGLSVLHACDTPSCLRLPHLMLGSQMANVRDALNKGRRPQNRSAA